MRTAAGSEFHILGAATENARLPVDVLVLGMKRHIMRDSKKHSKDLVVTLLDL